MEQSLAAIADPQGECEQARQSVDLYLNPELAGISLLDWKAFDRIVTLGYQCAKEALSKMSDEELETYRNLPVAARAQRAVAAGESVPAR